MEKVVLQYFINTSNVMEMRRVYHSAKPTMKQNHSLCEQKYFAWVCSDLHIFNCYITMNRNFLRYEPHNRLPSTSYTRNKYRSDTKHRTRLVHIIQCAACYLPLESSLYCVSSLVHFHTEITFSFSKCIFLGDFNFSDVDWSREPLVN